MLSTLSIGLAAAISLMVAVWALSLVKRDASIVDAFWGLGFVLVAWVYYALAPEGGRRLVVPLLVTLWGVRLSGYIAWRNHGRGEDYRYREMRERWGPSFPLASLFVVFGLQALILWVVSWPLAAAQRGPAPVWPSWPELAGAALFAIGFLFESIGDLQLAWFKSRPENRGQVMDRGLWRYTRHPNYFGDALVWWGLWLVALAVPGAWWTVVGPLLMTFLLMKVSGVALLEQKLRETRPAYRDYVERTSAFFPWPPRPSNPR